LSATDSSSGSSGSNIARPRRQRSRLCFGCSQTTLELAESFARYRYVVVARAIRGSIRAIARTQKLEKRVRLTKRDQLLLAQLTDECLAAV